MLVDGCDTKAGLSLSGLLVAQQSEFALICSERQKPKRSFEYRTKLLLTKLEYQFTGEQSRNIMIPLTVCRSRFLTLTFLAKTPILLTNQSINTTLSNI